MLFRAILVAFFILANSFFVAAEFALVSVRETRLEQLIAGGRPGARTALQLKRNLDDFLPAVQLGVTLAALALGWVGEPAVAEMLLYAASRVLHVLPPHATVYAHGIAVVIAFAVITYFEVLLGELVPKSLALQRTERIALAVAAPMDVFIRITGPIVRVMNSSAAAILRLFHVPLSGEGPVHSPEELKMIATSSRRRGLLPEPQEQIIHRAIELSHVTTREIMTPRAKIFSLPANLSVERASARIVEEQHSRIPVYETGTDGKHKSRHADSDQIIGIVYSKDVSRLMHFRSIALSMGGSGITGLTLREVMREPFFVPETKLAVELLQDFRTRRRHVAVVVDEFGSTVGLVTAEDALEQIVGEMEDEFDIVSRPMPTSATGATTIDGSAPLRDLTTQFQWAFPREPGVETLAGFILTQLGHIPEPNESISYDQRRYTVTEMVGNRIGRIRVEPLPAEPGAPAARPEQNAEAA